MAAVDVKQFVSWEVRVIKTKMLMSKVFKEDIDTKIESMNREAAARSRCRRRFVRFLTNWIVNVERRSIEKDVDNPVRKRIWESWKHVNAMG